MPFNGKFSSRKPVIWDKPVGLKFARRRILLTYYERACIELHVIEFHLFPSVLFSRISENV